MSARAPKWCMLQPHRAPSQCDDGDGATAIRGKAISSSWLSSALGKNYFSIAN